MSTNLNDSSNIIQAENLIKKFGDFEAVRGVSFGVKAGECFGLLGPNGAGKTSIVKMVYGFSPVTKGSLRVFGVDVMREARRIKARIGVVPQEDNLDPELSVWDNLLVYAGYFRINRQEAERRAQQVMEFMELTEKAKTAVDSLSGGLRRRLTLGRALLNQPEILVLDEPTTGLDPYARHMLWQRLRRLKESGTTMLLTTHYLEEASQLCDRLVILYKGTILEEGSPEGLIDQYVGKEALELGVNSNCTDQLLDGIGELAKGHQRLGDVLVVFSNLGQELTRVISNRAVERGIPINYRRLRPSNLEDVFLKLTGETLQESDTDNENKGW